MELIKRYVYAVTRRLPEKQRNDVSKELLSDIEAMVSDRAGNKKPTEKHIKDVLKELGDPVVFARQYDEGKKYLIGPRFFDMYVALLKTLLYVIPPIIAVITLVAGMLERAPATGLIIETVGAAIEIGVHIFFWVTLVFVVLERSGVESIESTGKVGAWTPDDLPELLLGNRIPRSEAINGIVWSFVCALWVLWQVPAVHALFPLHVPVFFSEHMWPYWTLGLLAIAIGAVVVEVIKLIKGVWSLFIASIVTIINSLLIMYVFAVAIFVQPIVNESAVQQIIRASEESGFVDILMIIGIVTAATIIIVSSHGIVTAWRKYKKMEG